MTKNQLIVKRERLLEELNDINQELRRMEELEKPYIAAISSYNGSGETKCKTEVQARKKYQEYCGKTYYRNGLTRGAYLYQFNADGTKTLLDYHPMGQKDFYPRLFRKGAM